MPPKLTTLQFIEKSHGIHGDKYDYSLVEYVDNVVKVKIICTIHGVFEQRPYIHLHGHGCKLCSIENQIINRTSDTNKFIEKSSGIHGDKYDYSLVEYVDNKTKVKIICKIHGIFEQRPSAHLQGQGCMKCRNVKLKTQKLFSNDIFIEKSKDMHGDKYGYEKSNYIGSKNNVTIICPIHGEFRQIAENHYRGNLCPRCTNNVSSYEIEICNFLQEHGIEYNRNVRSLIKPYEIDIIIPKFNLGIEFCGTYWHSEQKLKKYNDHLNYHKNKYQMCIDVGYRLLTIFEPEWIYKKSIIKSIILAKCNIYNERLFGRKCEINKVTNRESKLFFDENHIQGYARGVTIGLYHNDTIVSSMILSKYKDRYQLVRFVNKKNTIVLGAFSKLLKYFIKTNTINGIDTFADLRYFNGDVYLKNGFINKKTIVPRYYYFKGNSELLHRRNFQHKQLKNKLDIYDSELTEYQNMLNNGYDRIWDCGKIKFEMNIGDINGKT